MAVFCFAGAGKKLGNNQFPNEPRASIEEKIRIDDHHSEVPKHPRLKSRAHKWSVELDDRRAYIGGGEPIEAEQLAKGSAGLSQGIVHWRRL